MPSSAGLKTRRAESTLQTMSGKKALEQQIAALDALRDCEKAVRVAALAKALANRNNFIVAKAADLAREFQLAELVPELLAAFDRFFENPEKTDPQCWAKNALSRTLAAFEHQDSNVFLRGMRHIQLEPAYGGRSDSAGTLRSTCTLALVQCRSLTNDEVLAHLVDLFADKDAAVRAESARAIEQVGSPAAALLLRLRATLGNDEPEVLGACFGGIVRIEGSRAIPWVGHFLAAADDTGGEAALAIAGTHSLEAFEFLRDALPNANDPWFRSVLLSAIALTRQDAALEFLLEVVRTESMDAQAAIEALARSAPSEEVLKRINQLVSDNPRLSRALEKSRTNR